MNGLPRILRRQFSARQIKPRPQRALKIRDLLLQAIYRAKPLMDRRELLQRQLDEIDQELQPLRRRAIRLAYMLDPKPLHVESIYQSQSAYLDRIFGAYRKDKNSK